VSLLIHVEAYSGNKANERPISFWLDPDIDNFTGIYEIDAVEDRWYDPNAQYFKVRTPEGKRYILRSDREAGQWTLQSGFDGAELLTRDGIEFVSVEPASIRTAESKITGCERCRNYESDIPFSFVIADLFEKHGAFDFILAEPGHCPNCNGELSEKTRVEPQGGIEVETGIRTR
jgi:hypothetical protein